MKEATEQVATEAPKTAKKKEGTKVETAVDGVSKKVRAPRVPSNTTYRILAGVEASKFRGQRQIVVTALQSLGEGAFTIEQIAGASIGLVSKTPVEASVKYHLSGLVADKQVEAIQTAAPETAATAEKAA